jgi:hypothetical protein
VESVVDKVALGRIFTEYFCFPCQSSFHQILHHHNHPGQATIGQSVAAEMAKWYMPMFMFKFHIFLEYKKFGFSMI